MADYSKYLTDDEIDVYCSMLPVTSEQVMFASGIIDCFVGTNKGQSKFQESTESESRLKPNRKGFIRLKHSPIVSITKVQFLIPSGIGFNSTQDVDSDCYNFDEDGYLYVPMFGPMRITPSNLYGAHPVGVNVDYTWGYSEIPQNVKLCCAMIAMNISQLGGFTSIQSVTNLDARYALADPSVFTSDIRHMLAEYK